MDKLLQELDTFFKDNKWNQIVKKTKSIISDPEFPIELYASIYLFIMKIIL